MLYFPQSEISELGPITLSATTPGFALGEATYYKGGSHQFEVEVPRGALCTNILPVTFSLDKYLPPSQQDGRTLGTVVTSISLANE